MIYTRLSSAAKTELHKSPSTLRSKRHFDVPVPEESGCFQQLNTLFAKRLSGFNLTRKMLLKMTVSKKDRNPSSDALNPLWLIFYAVVLSLICLFRVWTLLSIHVFFQAFMCALLILKVSAWSPAKFWLYGFLSVLFSHGFIVLPNSCVSWYTFHIICFCL